VSEPVIEGEREGGGRREGGRQRKWCSIDLRIVRHSGEN
jgi:hypothetical protein